MIRPRSYSFDDSVSPPDLSDTDDSQLEKELAQKIASRKDRQKKEGSLFIRESSWLSMCCGLFSGSWQKRFAQLTSDRLILKLDEKSVDSGSIPLKHCKISISEVTGHDGRHNCLQINSFGYQAFLSFETNEELRAWAIALNYTVELLEKRTFFI
jgi:hypothetical protein